MYYIDGNNLAGVIPEVAVGTEPAEQLVTRLVQVWAKRTGKKVTLVFDGHRSFEKNVSGIRVEYPGSQDADADDVLRRFILKDSQKTNATLVTNDGELVRFARAHGVHHAPSREFVRLLQDTETDLHVERAERKPANPQGVEVDAWMKYFGMRPGGNRRK